MTAESSRIHTYRPGSWFGIFGDHATVLLPPSEKRRVAALWELVDDGAGFAEVLDALIAGGLRDLPAFVLASDTEGTTQVVLRGPATAVLTAAGETVELDGAGAATWVERSLAGVTSMTLHLEAAAEVGSEELSSIGGLARVGRIFVEGARPADAPAGSAAEAGVWDGRDTEAFAALSLGPEFASQPGYVEAEEEPVFGPFSPAGSAGGEPPADPLAGRPVARLEFSHGATVEVDRSVLIGRAPEALRFTSHDQPRLVTVPSPHQEISSTHVEIRPGSGADEGTAVVVDLGSTNGTVLARPGLGPEDLQPRVPVPLVPGAIVDLGDGLTITVARP